MTPAQPRQSEPRPPSPDSDSAESVPGLSPSTVQEDEQPPVPLHVRRQRPQLITTRTSNGLPVRRQENVTGIEQDVLTEPPDHAVDRRARHSHVIDVTPHPLD